MDLSCFEKALRSIKHINSPASGPEVKRFDFMPTAHKKIPKRSCGFSFGRWSPHFRQYKESFANSFLHAHFRCVLDPDLSGAASVFPGRFTPHFRQYLLSVKNMLPQPHCLSSGSV